VVDVASEQRLTVGSRGSRVNWKRLALNSYALFSISNKFVSGDGATHCVTLLNIIGHGSVNDLAARNSSAKSTTLTEARPKILFGAYKMSALPGY